MHERLVVPVYYDFASTLCFVAHRVLERMADDLEVLEIDLHWMPIDLVRLTGWRRGDPVQGLRRENALRVAAELDVPVEMPTQWMDSRRVGAIALALEGEKGEQAWRDGVWRGVYEESRSLDDADWLAGLTRELGVDPEAAAGRRGLEALELRTLEAAEAEVTGVPTFQFDGWPLGGIQEVSTMRSLFGRFATRKRGVH